MRWMSKLILVLCIGAVAFAAAPDQNSTVADDARMLDQQIRALLLERETVLNQLSEDAKLAPLSERVARDAEYADTQVRYEVELLNLMIEFYGITGNEELLQRAEANLAQILAPVATGTPEASSLNREPQSANGEER